MPDPNLRAADSDRNAVAAQLGRALSDGRLTVAEYDERVAQAYQARTYGELGGLLADLPEHTPAPSAAGPRPAGSTSAPVRAGACGGVRGRGEWGAWLSTAVVLTTIWVLTSLASGVHFFWPIWVIGIWGAVLLSRSLGGRPHHHRGRRSRGW